MSDPTGAEHANQGAWPDGPPWWISAVVYQVYPRSFADSDGDGVGDLRGILGRLDHLEQLGVDVVWLSPVYRSPHDDNGYDISDYQDIDPTFGTLADLDALVEAMHSRGMKLVMDLVVNHTSDEHPWFIESRGSTDNAKRDWYWWRPAHDGMSAGAPGAEPNNWGAAFSGPAWDLDPATGEYYLHLFSRKQPDLNWENPEVRAAIHAMMRWWLDRGVDGFRMDVVNFISKDPALPDGIALQGGVHGDGHPHYSYGPRLHEYLAETHREVFAGRPERLLTVGEMPGATVDQAVKFTDPARAELDMVFTFEHVSLDQGATKWDLRPLRLTDLKATFGRWQAGLAEVGWNSLYWSNHDQPRAVSRFGDDGMHRVESAKALGTLLHLHRGTPYVYQGEELGMTNAHFSSIDNYRDIESLNQYAEALHHGWSTEDQTLTALAAKSRDNARTPMQWDTSQHAGFTHGEPWIAVNPNYLDINVAAQTDDPTSVLAHYRRLIALRHTEPAVALGDFTMLLPDHEQVYAFTRTLEDTSLLVLVNVSGHEQTVDLPDVDLWADAELLLCNYDREQALTDPLRPWEATVHRSRRHPDSRRPC